MENLEVIEKKKITEVSYPHARNELQYENVDCGFAGSPCPCFPDNSPGALVVRKWKISQSVLNDF